MLVALVGASFGCLPYPTRPRWPLFHPDHRWRSPPDRPLLRRWARSLVHAERPFAWAAAPGGDHGWAEKHGLWVVDPCEDAVEVVLHEFAGLEQRGTQRLEGEPEEG